MRLEKRNRIAELDVLRGFAALAVVIFHFTMNDNAIKLGWEFRYGVTGVDIFFMISGFVIYMSILRINRAEDFVVFRFARLYPTYWVCVTITALFVLYFEPQNFGLPQVIANLTMFPTYFGIEDLDGSYWTLLVELWFYFWIFLLLVYKKIDAIINHSLVIMAVIAVFHLLSPYYPSAYQYITLKIQILNHFPLFFSGIVFYKVKFNGLTNRYILCLCASFLLACYLHDKGGRSMYHISAWEHYGLILGYHLIFVLFIMERLNFLITKPFLYLGKISYSLYLLHQYIGSQLINALQQEFSFSIEIAILLTLIISLMMASIINQYIETPLNDQIRRWYSKKSQKIKQFA
ncbi:acyltransferase family protein [Dyadobacter tibetensis]|uniref:acyltransferase family protein n=1 Tax=Dyadobacter tibetensis TaxID=1211851 RepID=UPI00046F11DE|nr:acyltransferase [Dyadobacter tibetensis]